MRLYRCTPLVKVMPRPRGKNVHSVTTGIRCYIPGITYQIYLYLYVFSIYVHTRVLTPILPVLTVKSVDEAIAFCGGKPTPTVTYVFEQD